MSGPPEDLPYPPDDPSAVLAAADRCQALAAVAAHLEQDLGRDLARLAAAWQGPAAAACSAELRGAVRLAGSLTDPLHRSAGQLREHARTLTEARSAIDALRREAQAARQRLRCLQVDGLGPGPARRLLAEQAEAETRDGLTDLRRRYDAVVERVAEHTRLTALRLQAAAAAARLDAGRPGLAARLPLLAAARRAAGVGDGPPPRAAGPETVRAWWAALTPAEQRAAVLSWPGRLGSLAGLPAAVRSAANERRLGSDLQRLGSLPVLSPAQQRRRDACLLVRGQLARVRAALDPADRSRLAAQLLVFEPAAFGYQGRVAIAVGDLDSADNVAVLVPGLGSDVRATLTGLTGDALQLAGAARRTRPAATTAAVAWLGYDAPGLPAVAFDGAARRGADLLAADLRALQAARQFAPHLTLVGHSYGSTTVGVALREHRTGTDDAVLVGSPGPDADRAAQLHLRRAHVFVGAASRDPVSYLDRFGTDPAHASFGAVRFEAEDPSRNPWRLDWADHSKYFHDGTESLANIARVVTGDYRDVVPAPYRAEVPLLPDGIRTDPEAWRAPTVP